MEMGGRIMYLARRLGGPQPLHASGKIGPRRSQEEMVMVVHEDIGEDLHLESRRHFPQSGQKSGAVFIVQKDGPTLVAARHDMVKGPLVFNAPRSCHADSMPSFSAACQGNNSLFKV